MALCMPFILVILEKMLSKPSNHGQSNGGAPITSVFFFYVWYIIFNLFHLFQTCFQFHHTLFKKFAFTTSTNVFQLLFLNGLQFYSQYLLSTRSNKHKKLTFIHDLPTSFFPTTSSLGNPNSKALVYSTCDAKLFSSSPSNK
jgi:membrane protein insertase Oxa1/YidC/SpoIIIJ